ncbi:MAG: murein biosynthesis integral membrane protein MurJ [Anaerolineae bacterium]|nr:murein biosynthesis integral membrane protein MurJ [Thermoflexus sp.]MDW8064023.1 murein biosynthesis integral membrane protein MurJ [Anaerolineae bacterium]
MRAHKRLQRLMQRLSPWEIETLQFARDALIIALGNIVSRLIGLFRETVKSELFGSSGPLSAFEAAAVVPIQLYDLLVGGMVSSALVPVFREYADRLAELRRLAGAVLTWVWLIMGCAVLIVQLAAKPAAWLLAGGLEPELLELTANLLRWTILSVWWIATAGVLGGLLQACQRFALPAFTAAIFNAAMVTIAILFGAQLGVTALALGMVAGALLQVLLQLPALYGLWPKLSWYHPALLRIVQLYSPVVFGLAVNQIAILLSYHLASHAGPNSIAWMRYATTLIQFPLGLIVTAISVAILPRLSRLSVEARQGKESLEPFRATLMAGLRMVIALIIPAAFGLYVLADPVIDLLFQHGHFTATDTVVVAGVLRAYLPGLIFAAIDQPLVFAFYARQDTLTPAMVGLICNVGIYLAAALAPTLFRPLQVTDLAIANSVQWAAHALLMSILLLRQIGPMHSYGLGRWTAHVLIASLVMALGIALVWSRLSSPISPSTHLEEATRLFTVGGCGLIIYGFTLGGLSRLSVTRWS